VAQRQVFVNNLAVRRTAEELKTAADFQEMCRILVAAFEESDFDGFELRAEFRSGSEGLSVAQAACPHVRWRKPGSHAVTGLGNTWSLHLDLVSAGNHYCGTLIMFRRYAQRDLQTDVNLLTSIFASSLADALHRISRNTNPADIPTATEDSVFLQARAG
jgi:hypothetical protein